MQLDLLLRPARGCPGSTCISPVWLKCAILLLSLSHECRTGMRQKCGQRAALELSVKEEGEQGQGLGEMPGP